MSVKWTTEQQQVIDLRDRNILVSAAAGSGKTAVLVERIITMLMDQEHSMDVDRLLIVTFTDAAASEMKERIRGAIEQAMEEDPSNVHLQRQSMLIHSAQITTIHSFCLSVIRDHFHLIDMDPGFRIAEEGELKLLMQDVLEELLEQCYVAEEKSFLELVEKLGTGRDDKKLGGLILKLYEFSRSYPCPKQWLKHCVEQYELNEQDGQPAIFTLAQEWIESLIPGLKELSNEMMKISEESDGPYIYCDALEADMVLLEKIGRCTSFQELYELLSSWKWKALSSKRDESINQEKKETVKALRSQLKKVVDGWKKDYFYADPKEMIEEMNATKGTMNVLADLVLVFGDLYAEKKKQKHLIDYEDMEQYALQILTEEKDGKLIPSMTAREYQEQFYEVMIDEYQDSNLIQEAILTSVSTVSQGENNIFMVGDVKQSIYRFRLSRPELFMEKYKTYTENDSDRQRVDLHKNFRSRVEVLDSVNYLFKRIMREELGGIRYDDRVALYPGAQFQEVVDEYGNSIYETEVLAVEDEGYQIETEIRLIAKKIKECIRTMQVTDKETGLLRTPQYRDFVILLRSVKSWSEELTTILAEEGVPTYLGNSEGYFETYEVSVLLDYLRLLDNQRQDLPLTAVLTSFLVGLDAQQLAIIRLRGGKGCFYEAVEEVAGWKEEDIEEEELAKIAEKLRNFYVQLSAFRDRVPFTAIHDLLQKIIEETGYGTYIAAMPGGEQRLANVEMLVEKAVAFEGTSYKGLFHFVRYIEQLQKYDIDYGEANVTGEMENTVRIMSIHKSKGLEFPIVIVAGLGRKFNTRDMSGAMLVHPELGVGLDCIDLERRTKTPTFLKKTIRCQTLLENLGEELRVLYVAMTRAKEKLILVGRIKTTELKENVPLEEEERISVHLLSDASSYMKWIAYGLDEKAPIKVQICGKEDLQEAEFVEAKAEQLARDVLEHWSLEQVYDPKLRTHLDTQFGYQYPYQEEQNLKMKFAVSELKTRTYLEEGVEHLYENLVEETEKALKKKIGETSSSDALIPRFMQKEKKPTGAARGSAYHKALELLDFQREYDEELLKETMKQWEMKNLMSKEMLDSVSSKDLLRFLQCPSAKRMMKAARKGKLYKEQPFVLGVDAKEIYKDTTSDERILVQGIIDVYFEEDGELVVLDYKTDHVRSPEQLIERYASQLNYYAQALEQLLQKRVKEKVIYSFELKKEIIL